MNQLGQNERNKAVGPSSGNEETDYFDYLRRRSPMAWMYRKFWLYPRLCRHLDGRVLDIGCGIGDLLSFRRDTVGTDINPRAVAWCRGKGHRVELMMPDLLPFESGEFDGAVIDNVLEHIEDPQPLLAEVRRIVRPGGSVLVGVPGRRGYTCDPDHKVFYDAAALVATLAAAGFGLQRLLHMPFKSAWLDGRMRQYCVYGAFRRG